MRRPIIAGNWKMNKTNKAADEFVKELISLVKDAEAEVVLCVPFTDIVTVRKAVRGTISGSGAEFALGGGGAYTGEISAEILKKLKVKCYHQYSEKTVFQRDQRLGNKKIGGAV